MPRALTETTLEEAASDVARLASLLDHVDATLTQRTRQLVWHGSAAERFDDRVRTVRAAGMVRLARLVRTDVYELGEIRWMDAGPGGVWRLADRDDDGEEEDSTPSVVIEDVGEADLRDDLRALIGEE